MYTVCITPSPDRTLPGAGISRSAQSAESASVPYYSHDGRKTHDRHGTE